MSAIESPMSRDAAMRVLALDVAASAAEVERALAERVTLAEERLRGAPGEALKARYRERLDELESARAVLLAAPSLRGMTDTMVADLPLAESAHTHDGGGSPALRVGLALEPGQELAGRYVLRERIGSGGMGVVYRAFDRHRDKDIAIKVLLPQLLSSPRARERLFAEARLASELSHPNIATVFDVQQDGVSCFITMELLSGSSLRERLRKQREERRPFPLEEALSIAGDVAAGLGHAHARTVHRDVKPENIWLAAQGPAKVMDFGIALSHANECAEGMAPAAPAGTPYYMAPEQLSGAESIDGRADQYALAVVLHEMLAGAIPAGRMAPLRTLRRDVPGAVSAAVDKALAIRPQDRFPDVGAFREALGKRGIGASPRARRLLAGAAGAAALVFAVGAGFWGWRTERSSREAEQLGRQAASKALAEARAVLAQLDAKSKRLRSDVAAAQRDVERVEAEAAAKGGSPALAARYREAHARAFVAAGLDRELSRELEGEEGQARLAGEIAMAETQMKDGHAGEAAAVLTRVREGAFRLMAHADGIRGELESAAAKREVSLPPVLRPAAAVSQGGAGARSPPDTHPRDARPEAEAIEHFAQRFQGNRAPAARPARP